MYVCMCVCVCVCVCEDLDDVHKRTHLSVVVVVCVMMFCLVYIILQSVGLSSQATPATRALPRLAKAVHPTLLPKLATAWTYLETLASVTVTKLPAVSSTATAAAAVAAAHASVLCQQDNAWACALAPAAIVTVLRATADALAVVKTAQLCGSEPGAQPVAVVATWEGYGGPFRFRRAG
jgi:hypothetical protein